MRPTCEPCPPVVDRESLILATEDRSWSRRERIVTLKVLSISVAQGHGWEEGPSRAAPD